MSRFSQGQIIRSVSGAVACCICFEWFELDELAVDEHGDKIDVCQRCWHREELIKRDRWCHSKRKHAEHGVCLGWPR